MITSLAWVPKGAARSRPVRFELSSEEYSRIKSLADIEELKEKENEKEYVQKGKTFANDNDEEEDTEKDNFDDLPPELRMDEYDDDESLNGGELDDLEDEEIAVMEEGELAFAMDKDDFDEDEEEDNEDDEIRPTDSLLVVAITEDEYSHLEVQLLSEDGNLYVHHDITLPEMPLCLAWLDCPPYQTAGGQGAVGNYMAVGTFAPAIEIWNLDVLDPLEPSATLGGVDETKKQKKNKPVYKPGSHEAAVMALSWNTTYRQALASGSADNSVKIWDVTTQACSFTFTHHKKEVQSINWHSTEAWLLATASFDRTVSLIDCRSGSNTIACSALPSDPESLHWNPFSSYHLYCSTEEGQVVCIDVRNTAQPVFTFQAHAAVSKKDREASCATTMSFSSRVPGLLATASTDKTVKVWDVNSVEENTPKCVAYKSMNVGKLLTLQFNADDPFMLATGGDKGMVAIWESDELDYIKNHFESRVIEKQNPYANLQHVSDQDISAHIANNNTNNNNNQTKSEMEGVVSNNAQVNTTEDDSWMNDNTGIAGAATNGGDEKKKKKKNKDKKK